MNSHEKIQATLIAKILMETEVSELRGFDVIRAVLEKLYKVPVVFRDRVPEKQKDGSYVFYIYVKVWNIVMGVVLPYYGAHYADGSFGRAVL